MAYPTLKNLLLSVLSIDVGLSESAEAVAIERFLQNQTVCEKLRSELLSFDASGESWMELLDNEHYCVYPTDSEEEAKQFVMDKFGKRLLG
ncbi:hypothetical protein ACQUKI_15955 [Ralstonia pseudosolanacearum]